MIKLTQKNAFLELEAHYKNICDQHMQDWFKQDQGRFDNFSLNSCGILLDYSKNRITKETLRLLIALADESDLSNKINDMFSGKNINFTENRPVLHTALRDANSSVRLGEDLIQPHIQNELQRLTEFTDQVRSQHWRGSTGKPITDIVNIGIGGSHLGSVMAIQALKNDGLAHLCCHFISNIDEDEIQSVLKKINPETTLFIISSKTFTTFETLKNAKKIRSWLQEKLSGINIDSHFVAITSHPQKAIEFGIPTQQIFTFWEWVGGRYSIWSSIALPLILMIGMDQFKEFLSGAYDMDQHFRNTPFEKNMPVILALLGIWYINFFNANQHALIPYSFKLNHLPEYIQQLDMESNGKNVHYTHEELNYFTAPIIFGKHGGDSQHSFFQLFHQGKHIIPADFIVSGEKDQDELTASAFAQAQALMQGKDFSQALAEAHALGFKEDDAINLAKHKVIPGNRPSNVIFLPKIDPYHLGALLALYEHKTFIQGLIWGINSFDQWGVELGKSLLPQVLNDLKNHSPSLTTYDSSTFGLIQHFKNLRNHNEK